MQPLVPVVIVPGFYGFLAGDASVPLEMTPSGLLTTLWLSHLEGHESTPSAYHLVLPEESVLCRDLPPDLVVEELSRVLKDWSESDRLFFYAYDWRQSLVASAVRLAEELESQSDLLGSKEIDLVTHGPGGLIVRYLLESGTLSHGARLVRRVVHIATPHYGMPSALVLLCGLLRMEDDKQKGLEEILRGFPSAIQLIPPRGVSYLFRAGNPGFRLEPFSWPELFLGQSPGVKHRHPLHAELTACNESLHSSLKGAFDSSWRRCLAFASSSEPTISEIHVEVDKSGVRWTGTERSSQSGDGVVPIRSGLLHPTMRSFIVTGRHFDLPQDPGLGAQTRAFLKGQLS